MDGQCGGEWIIVRILYINFDMWNVVLVWKERMELTWQMEGGCSGGWMSLESGRSRVGGWDDIVEQVDEGLTKWIEFVGG